MELLDIRHLVHDIAQDPSPHAHAQGQMFTVQSGLVSVVAENNHWVMPSGCIGWVPPQVMHGAAIHGEMRGLSLYFDPDFSHTKMPAILKVVRTTPLLAALIEEITQDKPSDRLAPYLQVLADIFMRLPAQTLFVPMPGDSRLVTLSKHLLQNPDDDTDLDGFAKLIGMSRRTLTRRFQEETGWSLGHWRQQMRLLLALEKLSAGISVTTVALDMGYQSVSAFIAVFRKYLGCTPKAWLENK